jgi:alkylation response protein AidB-like acyl-CoA dehydrogenase
MALVLTEEQNLLKNTAADFVKNESPVSRLRQLRDEGVEAGYSRPMWTRMAELGFPGVLIPEAYGGLGLGYTELACVLEEFGRNLVPEPMLSSVLLGANAVLLGGSEDLKKELLPAVAAGEVLLALAYHERKARFDAFRCQTRATASGGGYVLSGEKTLVFGAVGADKLVVSARSSGAPNHKDGIDLFLVDADAPGLQVVAQKTMHLRPAAKVVLSDVEVAASARLGGAGGGGAILEDVIDRATLGLAAEMLGASLAAFEMTLEYLKTRQQFGVAIGSFQALKHRAANMFVELELARSAVLGACDAMDGNHADVQQMVSLAKARVSDTAMLVGYEGIQMHGGIGMTDEHDIGFYAKRARGDELTFGDGAWHRDRFASLGGF